MTKEERKAYKKAWYEAHKEEVKARNKAYIDSHKEQQKEYKKAWYQAHKEEYKAKCKAYRDSHKEEYRAYAKAHYKDDVNSLGQAKGLIRELSRQYLNENGTKIPGYEIHHCFTYDDPSKFIYCSQETHQLIHAYLREHNIDADSEHYEQIKHLLDNTVVVYGFNKGEN